MVSLLGQLPGDREQKSAAQSIATLPMRLGGLGLPSAARMSPAACWASWADALPMLQARLPQVTANIVGGLEREAPLTGCLGELQESARSLDHSGFVGRPGWTALRDGARPHDFVAEPVSGSMAGSTSRLPLSNTTFGRPLYWPSHLPRTRLICVPTRDMGPAVFSAVAQPHRNSRFSLHCSGRLCWRGSVSHCRSLKQSASVVLG